MNQNKKADLLLISATILAGFGWIFSKQTIQEMPPFMFIGIRFMMASLIFIPLCLPMLRKLSTQDIVKSALVGFLQGVVLLLWIYSVSITDALGEGAFIMSLSMLFVPLLAWPLFKQKPNTGFWMALPIAGAGLFMLSNTGEWQVSGSQLFFLLAALTLAVQFNLNSQFSKSIPTLPFTTIQFFCTGLLAILFSLLTENWPESIEYTTWGWLIASVIPATCLRFFLQISGQKHTSTANAAIIMILEPLWTVILSIMFYAEQMTFNKSAGCLLILAALVTYKLWGFIWIRYLKIVNR